PSRGPAMNTLLATPDDATALAPRGAPSPIRLSVEERRQQAAVDPVATAGAEGGLVAGEEEDEFGDFLRPPDAAERMEAAPFGDRALGVAATEGVGSVFEHRGSDAAGGDARAADVLVGVVEGDGRREADDAALRGSVG